MSYVSKTATSFIGVNTYKVNAYIISVSPPNVYDNYQDALDEDLEWSIEQIDKTLDHWSGFYHISDKQKKAYREFIMNLSNLENVEVRINAGDIQWKYWKNKRWKNIKVSNWELRE